MRKAIVFRSMGKHVAVSDGLNDLKERIIRIRHSRPTVQREERCYGKRCAVHHPVTIGEVATQQVVLVDAVSTHPSGFLQWEDWADATWVK